MGTFHDHVPHGLCTMRCGLCLVKQLGSRSSILTCTSTTLLYVDTKVEKFTVLRMQHAYRGTVYGKKFGYNRITVETPRGAPSNMLILDALHLHAGHRGLGGLRLLLIGPDSSESWRRASNNS